MNSEKKVFAFWLLPLSFQQTATDLRQWGTSHQTEKHLKAVPSGNRLEFST